MELYDIYDAEDAELLTELRRLKGLGSAIKDR